MKIRRKHQIKWVGLIEDTKPHRETMDFFRTHAAIPVDGEPRCMFMLRSTDGLRGLQWAFGPMEIGG
jgi:hypothetical protein